MLKLLEGKIEYGMCDTKAQLKMTEIAKLIEAGVTSFLKLYQKDNLTMKVKYGALWLFTKTKFIIDELPNWDDEVIVEASRLPYESKLVTIIEVLIHTKDKAKCITAWVECCCANIATRKLMRLSEYDFTIPALAEDMVSYERWDLPLVESRRLIVSSSYIDFSHHTNNTEYLRMIMDEFSIAELEKLNIQMVEIHYLAESKEKDELIISKGYFEGSYYFKIANTKAIAEVKIKEVARNDIWKTYQ